MIGQKFGKLTTVKLLEERSNRQKIYLCICDCGKEARVLSGNLRKGNSTSCGCSRRLSCSIRCTSLNLRHGQTETKLWRTWKGVVERTTKIKSTHYARYGGRGIGIDPAWLTYENFARDVGQPPSDQHSIDRIDNSKGYEISNVRWATAKQQADNRCTTIYVDVQGVSMSLSDAARLLQVSKSTTSRWLASGKLKVTSA